MNNPLLKPFDGPYGSVPFNEIKDEHFVPAIKKGIMELVDGLVINKADGDSIGLAKQSCQHYRNAFHLLRNNDVWNPEVLSCSAMNREGIDEVWALIERFVDKTQASGAFSQRRSQQNLDWMKKLVFEVIEQRMQGDSKTKEVRQQTEQAVMDGKITPFAAATKLTEKI